MKYTFTNSGIEETVEFSDEQIENVFLPLLKKLTEIQKEKKRRILVFLAAPPGAGKSTLASFLTYLSEIYPDITDITAIGMDGFHRYQDYLKEHFIIRDGKEINMVDVKGAPETFDLILLEERIKRILNEDSCGWPIYDRLLHNPVDPAISVKGDIVLLEGNYLLLDWDGWRDLKDYADFTIRINADEALLRERLIERKISTGVEREKAETFVDFSDMYNVRTCLKDSMKADLELYCR